MMPSTQLKVDRQTSTPFLLNVLYNNGAFPVLLDANASLPPYLKLYTWPTSTLLELSHLIVSELSSERGSTTLPYPVAGTRLCFRLIYPDPRTSQNNTNSNTVGRFLTRDLGSVVIGGNLQEYGFENLGGAPSNEDSIMLADGRFVIGDYLAVAILPPLGDGAVAPPIREVSGSREAPFSMHNGGMGGRGRGRGMDVNGGSGDGSMRRGFEGSREYVDRGGFGGSRGRGRGGGQARGGFGFGRGVAGLPDGEWRRGEQLPGVERSMGGSRGRW